MESNEPYFLDYAILSLDANANPPRYYLEKFRQFFAVIGVHEFREYEENGKLHYIQKYRDRADVERYLDMWFHLFEFLTENIDKYRSPGYQPQKNVPNGSEEPLMVLRCWTNIPRLRGSFINFFNHLYPRIGIDFYFENVLDGFIVYVKDAESFENYVSDPTDDQVVRDYYRRIGLDSEEFLEARLQCIGNAMREIFRERPA